MQNGSKISIKKIDELYEIAAENGICIIEKEFEYAPSCSVRISEDIKAIGLSARCGQEYLAHELGHCMTDSFYLGYSPLELRSKHEFRADKWAVNKLIPFDELCEAVKAGNLELWELADYFDVGCEFVEKAINYYKSYGMEVPMEYYM